MAILQDGQHIKAYKGDSKPVNLYLGNKKISGWKMTELSGTSVSVDDTYEDEAYVKINGKSQQTVTVQSDNIAEITTNTKYSGKPILESGWLRYTRTSTTGYCDVAPIMSSYVKKLIDPAKTYKIFIEVTENTFSNGSVSFTRQYSPFANSSIYFNALETGVKSASSTINTDFNISTEYEYFIMVNNPTNAVTGETVKFRYSLYEVSKAPATYVYNQFIPNSPSPDYQSLITSSGNFNLISTNGSNKSNSVHIAQTLRSLPNGIYDYIEIDNVAKTATLYSYISEKVYTGAASEYWYKQTTNLNNVFRFTSYPSNLMISGWVISSHFSRVSYNALYGGAQGIAAHNTVSQLNICHPIFDAMTLEQFKTWLATQYAASTPVTVNYQLTTPAITNLDYNSYKCLSYYPQTYIYTDAAVQPPLEIKIRTLDI